MEDIDGGLHPAVDGRSLDEDDEGHWDSHSTAKTAQGMMDLPWVLQDCWPPAVMALCTVPVSVTGMLEEGGGGWRREEEGWEGRREGLENVQKEEKGADRKQGETEMNPDIPLPPKFRLRFHQEDRPLLLLGSHGQHNKGHSGDK